MKEKLKFLFTSDRLTGYIWLDTLAMWYGFYLIANHLNGG